MSYFPGRQVIPMNRIVLPTRAHRLGDPIPVVPVEPLQAQSRSANFLERLLYRSPAQAYRPFRSGRIQPYTELHPLTELERIDTNTPQARQARPAQASPLIDNTLNITPINYLRWLLNIIRVSYSDDTPFSMPARFWGFVKIILEEQEPEEIELLKKVFSLLQNHGSLFRFDPHIRNKVTAHLSVLSNCPPELLPRILDFVLRYRLNHPIPLRKVHEKGEVVDERRAIEEQTRKEARLVQEREQERRRRLFLERRIEEERRYKSDADEEDNGIVVEDLEGEGLKYRKRYRKR